VKLLAEIPLGTRNREKPSQALKREWRRSKCVWCTTSCSSTVKLEDGETPARPQSGGTDERYLEADSMPTSAIARIANLPRRESPDA